MRRVPAIIFGAVIVFFSAAVTSGDTFFRSGGGGGLTIAAADLRYLPLTGGTLTGSLFMNSLSISDPQDNAIQFIDGNGPRFVDGNSGGGLQFNMQSLTALRTETAPDASGTIVLDTAAQTLTAKTLTTPVLTSVAFASLGTPSNGVITYCSNCTKATPCASGGTGALAKRLNGAWDCN